MIAAPCPAPASPGRAAAALRLTVRLELAEMLQRRVPRHVSVFVDGDEIEAEAELHPTDARELASDLVEELAARGYAIVRTPA